MNILEKIVASKRQEVVAKKTQTPVETLEQSLFYSRPCISLRDGLLKEDATGIIAEFKRRSPSRGIINDSAKIETVLKGYQDNGASGVSILTDQDFFGGSTSDISDHRKDVILPILRKDFIVDVYQILEAKAIGADVILLIAACLTRKEVKHFSNFAVELGLEVLLEIHDVVELEHICDSVTLVGINNRDLKTFSVDMTRSIQMAEQLPDDTVKIAESGIYSMDDIATFRSNGFKGFLIGERFMKEADPGIAFGNFVKETNHSQQHD